jgi:hypothetical protein
MRTCGSSQTSKDAVTGSWFWTTRGGKTTMRQSVRGSPPSSVRGSPSTVRLSQTCADSNLAAHPLPEPPPVYESI